MCEPFFINPILLSSTHLMEDTPFFSSAVLWDNWTSSPLYGYPQVKHVADCSIFLYHLRDSLVFHYILLDVLHPWIRPGSHSLHCWMSTRPSILSQGSMTLFDSRSIIISSQTHSIQLPTFFIPSNHVLTSPDSPSFHSAFIYTHHKGKSIKTVIHSLKKGTSHIIILLV